MIDQIEMDGEAELVSENRDGELAERNDKKILSFPSSLNIEIFIKFDENELIWIQYAENLHIVRFVKNQLTSFFYQTIRQITAVVAKAHEFAENQRRLICQLLQNKEIMKDYLLGISHKPEESVK